MAAASAFATHVATETTATPAPSSYTASLELTSTPRVAIQVVHDLPMASSSITWPEGCKVAVQALGDGVCRMMLHTIHVIYLAVIVSKMLHTAVMHFVNGLSPNVRLAECDGSVIHRDRQCLTKIPKHLSVVVSQELLIDRSPEMWNTIVDEICRASCWAWEFGIQEMSVFDGSGVLKSMAVNIDKRQSSMLLGWMNASRSEKPRPALKFTVLSTEDGKAQLATVAQNVAKHIKTSTHLTSKDIDIDMVNTFVHANSMSDPDLVLLYDGLPHNYISLDGYPPWHVRLSEFINESSCHHLDYPVFSKCLFRYSGVEQRFGH